MILPQDTDLGDLVAQGKAVQEKCELSEEGHSDSDDGG